MPGKGTSTNNKEYYQSKQKCFVPHGKEKGMEMLTNVKKVHASFYFAMPERGTWAKLPKNGKQKQCMTRKTCIQTKKGKRIIDF